MRRWMIPVLMVGTVLGVSVMVFLASGRTPERAVIEESAPIGPASPVTTSFPFLDDDAPGPRTVDPPSDPDGTIVIGPGDDVAAVVQSAPPGATVRFREGVYRGVQIEVKDDQTFVADPGVVLNGSRVLSGFRKEGQVWVLTNQAPISPEAEESNDWGFCDDDRPMCVFPEDLFFDGEMLERAASESAVAADTWFFDQPGERIVLGRDPAAATVEIGSTTWAFHGSSDRVEIHGFTIVQYASPGRQGAINPRSGGRIGPAGRGWTVSGNTIVHAHGWGIKVEDGMTIADNVIIGNGQGGIGGVGDGLVIEHNLIEGNCTAGFRCLGWEGGALKLSTSQTTMRSNLVRGNLGHGLHTDIDCEDIVMEGNLVVDNQGAGIHHEISGSALIRSNVVRNNGFRPDGVADPGILILDSSNVVVEGNVVEGNALGVLLRQDHRTSEGRLDAVLVRDNDIAMSGDQRTGWAISERAFLIDGDDLQLRFEDNRYRLSGEMASAFQADDDRMGFADWQALGYDVDGRAENAP